MTEICEMLVESSLPTADVPCGREAVHVHWQDGHRVAMCSVCLEARLSRPPRHLPGRGSDVEAWLKSKRDEYEPRGFWGPTAEATYYALDNLLDDYRLRSDTGRSLSDKMEDDE